MIGILRASAIALLAIGVIACAPATLPEPLPESHPASASGAEAPAPPRSDVLAFDPTSVLADEGRPDEEPHHGHHGHGAEEHGH